MKKLSSKQKNRLLIPAGFILLWLIYSFAISNTLDMRATCSTLEAQLDSAAGAPARLVSLQADLGQMELLTGDSSASAHGIHEKLLGIVTNYCQQHDLILRDFAQPIRYRQDEWLVETHPIRVEGNYTALLQLV